MTPYPPAKREPKIHQKLLKIKSNTDETNAKISTRPRITSKRVKNKNTTRLKTPTIEEENQPSLSKALEEYVKI